MIGEKLYAIEIITKSGEKLFWNENSIGPKLKSGKRISQTSKTNPKLINQKRVQEIIQTLSEHNAYTRGGIHAEKKFGSKMKMTNGPDQPWPDLSDHYELISKLNIITYELKETDKKSLNLK